MNSRHIDYPKNKVLHAGLVLCRYEAIELTVHLRMFVYYLRRENL